MIAFPLLHNKYIRNRHFLFCLTEFSTYLSTYINHMLSILGNNRSDDISNCVFMYTIAGTSSGFSQDGCPIFLDKWLRVNCGVNSLKNKNLLFQFYTIFDILCISFQFIIIFPDIIDFTNFKGPLISLCRIISVECPTNLNFPLLTSN